MIHKAFMLPNMHALLKRRATKMPNDIVLGTGNYPPWSGSGRVNRKDCLRVADHLAEAGAGVPGEGFGEGFPALANGDNPLAIASPRDAPDSPRKNLKAFIGLECPDRPDMNLTFGI